MRNFFPVFFICFAIPVFSQTVSQEKTLSKIFIEIPDTFFKPLERELPDSVKINRGLRMSMIDSMYVTDDWTDNLQFTAFDTVNCFLELLCKQGDPESMWSQIAFWNKKDGSQLVMMTINYSDMCVVEQTYRYFWNYDGKKFTPVSETDVIPDVESEDCISATFLKKHKKARMAGLPYCIGYDRDSTAFNFSPEFDYLFSCEESFVDDAWFGLTEDDIIRNDILLEWNGNKFTFRKKQARKN